MMIGPRQRDLKQIYDSTREISEPKITPVLEGLYKIQGPVEESENELNTPNSVDFAEENEKFCERKSPKYSKGECNNCSAPCINCSHLTNKPQNEMKRSRSKRVKKGKKEENNSVAVSEAGQNSTRDLKYEKNEEKELREEAVIKSELTDQNIEDMKGESDSSAELAGKRKDEENESEESPKSEETKPEIAKNKFEKGEKSSSCDDKSEKGEKSSSCDDKSEKGENSNSSDNNSKEKIDDETDNEEEIEEDVKVCDICGDVGEEDKLAVCTKCTDGAEHTYCMRVFMKKLPEGEWLCEECEVEAEKEKLLQKKGKRKVVNKVTEKSNADEFEYLMDQEDEFLAIELLKKESKSKAPRSLNTYAKKRDQEESLKKLESVDSKKPELESGISKKPELGSGILKKQDSGIPKKLESVENKKVEIGGNKKLEKGENKKSETGENKKLESGDLKKKEHVQIRENLNNSSDLEKGKLGTSVSNPPVPMPPPRGNLSKPASFKSALSKEPKVKQITEVPQNQKIAKSTSFKKPPMKPSSKLSEDSRLFKDPKEKNPTNNNLNNNNININNNNDNNNNNKSGSILGRPSIGLLSTPKLDSTAQPPDNSGRNEMKKPLLTKPDDISTCPLLDSILQRSMIPVQNRVPRCQRCNETGHSIQSCPKNPALLKKNISERNIVKEGGLNAKRPRVAEPKELESSDSGKICGLPPVVLEQLRSTIIPQLDCIWQGCFELVKEGRPPDIFEGFQAHFSSSASPKLQNFLKNGFPLQVQLQEVPRQQIWPTQFVESGPTESHIALYFFAKDLPSYENCYAKLVESMRKNDVALRGCIGSIELLVYPSTVLPEYSQRWNRLFYLWGVFKGKSANLLKHENNFNGKSTNLSKHENSFNGKSANLSKDETNSKGESANFSENMETEPEKGKGEIVPHENEIRVLGETLIETRPNRKRSNSTEPLSNPELSDLNGEKEPKKAKVDLNGDLHLDERIDLDASCSTKTEKGENLQLPIQNSESSNLGFGLSHEIKPARQNFNLEEPPPDLELTLNPKPMLPFLSSPSSNNNDNNDINVAVREPIRKSDESASSSLSLSLAFTEGSKRTGEMDS